MILKEHNYDMAYIFEILISKGLNIFFKKEDSKINYICEQAIDYDEFEAMEYITNKPVKEFKEDIDLVKLYVEIKKHLTEQNKLNCFTINDIYDIPYPNASEESNTIRVLTLPNTKNIVNMYPNK